MTGFPAPHEPIPHSDIVERLIRAGRHHIQSAQEKLGQAGEFIEHDVAIHAGAAVELFAKALLIRVDRRLLYGDLGDVYQALLDATTTSAGHHVPIREAKVRPNRSIQAGTAIELVRRLDERIEKAAGGTRAVLGARNDAVHAGVVNTTSLRAVVTDAETFVVAVSQVLRQDTRDVLGRVEYEDWERRHAELEGERRQATQAKIDAAREAYQRLMVGIPADKATDLEGVLVTRPGPDEGDVTQEETCPACEYDEAWVAFVEDVDFDEDGVGGTYMALVHFYCPRCGLFLDPDEIIYTEINDDFEGEWGEPDEDMYRDR